MSQKIKQTKEVAIQTVASVSDQGAMNKNGVTGRKNKLRNFDDIDLIVCIFCRIGVKFQGLPATHYIKHLFKEHKVLYDPEFVVEKTLDNNFPLSEKPDMGRTKTIGEPILSEKG